MNSLRVQRTNTPVRANGYKRSGIRPLLGEGPGHDTYLQRCHRRGLPDYVGRWPRSGHIIRVCPAGICAGPGTTDPSAFLSVKSGVHHWPFSVWAIVGREDASALGRPTWRFVDESSRVTGSRPHPSATTVLRVVHHAPYQSYVSLQASGLGMVGSGMSLEQLAWRSLREQQPLKALGR